MEVRDKMLRLHQLSIGSVPKAMTALASLGAIPAAEVDIYDHNTPPDIVSHTLELIGLSVITVSAPRAKENKRYVATLCISPKKVMAEILALLHRPGVKRDNTYHSLYGVLMGYPHSAIEGFISNDKLPQELYQKELKDNPLAVFPFSNDNWLSETVTIQTWEDVLRRSAPEILKELLGAVV